MAVKARETLKSGQLSLPVMGVLLVAIISYTFLYNRVIDQFDDYQLKTIIGVISLTIMIGFFIISLRYISISFEMLLTHDRLIIERKFFFVKKQVAEVMLAQILDILPETKAKKHKENIGFHCLHQPKCPGGIYGISC